MIAVHVAIGIVLVPLVAGCGYLGLVATLALIPRRHRALEAPALRRFRIVVPAHNEAAVLPALFESIAALDYPRELFDVLVVAHNCTDPTASVAREHGCDVLELNAPDRQGKGHALAYALERGGGDSYDAVVFADADCTVSPNFLRAFDGTLESGAEALQAYYTMEIDEGSSTRLLRELALVLVHRVRPRGKHWYGGSAGLKGSGMCFTRRAVERVGWHATGLAEDVEQHNRLLLAGIRVEFVEEATVRGLAPAALSDAETQHRRWEAGRMSAARSGVRRLLFASVQRRSLATLDAAIELLIPPLSLLALAMTAALAVTAVAGSTPLFAAAAAGEAALALYFAVGLIFLRPRFGDVVRSLLALPAYVLWKLGVYVRAIFAKKSWERTRRI